MKKAWILSYPLSAQRRLISLGGCPGWSESSLGAHTSLLVLSWGGSNDLLLIVLAWWPSWSYDLHQLNKFCIPIIKASHEILLCSVQQLGSRQWKKVKQWPWPLVLICIHVITYSTIYIKFWFICFNGFYKIINLRIFQWKSIRKQSCPCHKVGQGQHKIIIWTNFVWPGSPMLYTKLEDNRPAGFGEEDF